MTDLPSRDVDRLENAMRDLVSTLNAFRGEIDATFVRKDVIGPQLSGMRKDIDSHSEIFTWLGRIVIGAVVLALLGLVIAQTGGAR